MTVLRVGLVGAGYMAKAHSLALRSVTGFDWPQAPTFELARAFSCMIFDARSVSRRCTTVTLLAKRVRNSASSIAESPPPTTAISWPRKK